MYRGYNSNLIEFMGGRYNVRTSITKRNNSSNHIFACSFDLVAHNSEKKGKLSWLGIKKPIQAFLSMGISKQEC